jgi:putative aminopeptidase FrvX
MRSKKTWETRRLVAALLFSVALSAQTPPTSLNPTVKQVVDAVSEERIAANLKKLESFGTRHILSPADDPVHGIGAAKTWIHDQFQSYSPKLQVSYQEFTIPKGARVAHEVKASNIIAVLPGSEPDICVLVTAHYDTVNVAYKPAPPPSDEEARIAALVKAGMDEAEARLRAQLLSVTSVNGPYDPDATAAQTVAPGVTDDGSGTAAVMELARVMSQHQYRKTVIFIAFAGEEIGDNGSKAYAAMAKQKGMEIEAVLNNDIIGSDVAGNGRTANGVLRVFAAGPEDSPARTLQRYAKQFAERYVPSMQIQMVFRADRFQRNGDHTSFTTQGFAAIRLTTPSENFVNQHTATDTFDHTSVPYTTRVTRMNAAVLGSLALAPPPPVNNIVAGSGINKGNRTPALSRGKSGYDAVMRWVPGRGSDIAGYMVVMRATTAPDWEREIWVGNVTSYTLPDVSIDDIVIGIRAVDKDGNQSLVAPYLDPVIQSLTTPDQPATQQ